MPGRKTEDVTLIRPLRNLRGGSQPILARADDGLLYVVKYADNPQGPNLAFNESMGSELFRACGLPAPEWKPLRLTDAFLDRNPSAWLLSEEGPRRPRPGWCFGSRYLGNGGLRLLEILPASSFPRLRHAERFWLAWMVDICAGHADHRQAIFRPTAAGELNAFFVDFGHFFSGPKGEPEVNFQASRYLDARIYTLVSSRYIGKMHGIAQRLDGERMWQRSETLPEEWKTATARRELARCLDRLASRVRREQILESMLDSIEQGRQREQERRQEGRDIPLPVLCVGVQTGRMGPGRIGQRARHPACA